MFGVHHLHTDGGAGAVHTGGVLLHAVCAQPHAVLGMCVCVCLLLSLYFFFFYFLFLLFYVFFSNFFFF